MCYLKLRIWLWHTWKWDTVASVTISQFTLFTWNLVWWFPIQMYLMLLNVAMVKQLRASFIHLISLILFILVSPGQWCRHSLNDLLHLQLVNTLKPRRNEQHFADDIFKRIFFNKNVWISIKISLQFVPKGPINNIPALVQIMAWRHSGDKPLSEPMMVSLPTHVYASLGLS